MGWAAQPNEASHALKAMTNGERHRRGPTRRHIVIVIVIVIDIVVMTMMSDVRDDDPQARAQHDARRTTPTALASV